MSELSQSGIEQTIASIAKITSSAEQFKVEFKAMIDREPTFKEKQAFQKAVICLKENSSTSSTSPPACPRMIKGYKFIRRIGGGGFGEVWEVEKDNKRLAVKMMSLDKLGPTLMEMRFAELIKLKCPFLIQYFDSFKDEIGEYAYVVMELCLQGDLTNLVKNLDSSKGVGLKVPRLVKIFTQLILGIHELHRNKILHRDLKLENIFVDAEDNVKIGDFGCAKILDATHTQASTFQGTLAYVSPEIFKGKKYGPAADMWSLGVVMYLLCTGTLPFGNDWSTALKVVETPFKPIPKYTYPSEITDTIHALLSKTPTKRPTTTALLRLHIVGELAAEKGLIKYFPAETVHRREGNTGFDPSVIDEADAESGESEDIEMKLEHGKTGGGGGKKGREKKTEIGTRKEPMKEKEKEKESGSGGGGGGKTEVSKEEERDVKKSNNRVIVAYKKDDLDAPSLELEIDKDDMSVQTVGQMLSLLIYDSNDHNSHFRLYPDPKSNMPIKVNEYIPNNIWYTLVNQSFGADERDTRGSRRDRDSESSGRKPTHPSPDQPVMSLRLFKIIYTDKMNRPNAFNLNFDYTQNFSNLIAYFKKQFQNLQTLNEKSFCMCCYDPVSKKYYRAIPGNPLHDVPENTHMFIQNTPSRFCNTPLPPSSACFVVPRLFSVSQVSVLVDGRPVFAPFLFPTASISRINLIDVIRQHVCAGVNSTNVSLRYQLKASDKEQMLPKEGIPVKSITPETILYVDENR